MNHSLPNIMRSLLVATLLIFCAMQAIAQNLYTDGVRKGMVKVKFTPAMTSSLPQARVNARNNQLTTGMTSFDAKARVVSAHSMYRLFPYDEKNEQKLRKHGLHLWYVVEIEESVDPKVAAVQFKELQEVAIAEVEHEKILAPYAVKEHVSGPSPFSTLPFNDPLLKDQWHYNNTLQTGFGDADVNLFEAWQRTSGASNIIVAVHDEGVDVNHEDLKANMWVNTAELNGQPGIDDDGNGYIDDINGYNFSKNSGKIDPQYHGTHVAGTVAAVNNNGLGVAGVAGGDGSGNGVKIMSLQIMGGGSIERSYIYAADNGAVISQNSWGYTSPGAYDQSVLDAIDYFVAEAGDFPGSPMKGGVVIFAAGNYNFDDRWYPAYHENTIAVTAIGPEWKKASYSNFGAWTEIAAPGGDSDYGPKNGVLSTIPGNKYAFLDGTSMACPHVSGIAALALANRNKQLTNTELKNKLLTGVVNIDAFNPDHVGLLGTGAIDAELAIRNDLGIAPDQITDLTVTGIAQEFATLTWTVPGDGDDDQPTAFHLFVHTDSITANNIAAAEKIVIKNTLLADSLMTYEVTELLGLTKYYFAITATDRWGNASEMSTVITATTNEGPKIVLDKNSQEITLAIDVNSVTTASHEITISNQAAGILRWNHLTRHRNTMLSFSAKLNYPATSGSRLAKEVNVGMQSVASGNNQLNKNGIATASFTPINKQYAAWPTNIIGDTDLTLTNSAAAKFFVSEAEGFNLTTLSMYLKHDPTKGPVIVEIYEGDSPIKKNLVYAQEYSHWSSTEAYAYITLDEQLYFEPGSTFWAVFHVPAGNQFPLGIGFEADPSYSDNCFMSFDMGATWTQLETLLGSGDFAWAITASSNNQHLGTYLNLEPGSGDISGFEQGTTALTADGSNLINGDYSAYLIIESNDATNRQLRVPVNLNVSGQKPSLQHALIADYGAVFMGEQKKLDLVIENIGFGNFNNPSIYADNAAFVVDPNMPWQIKAREQVVVSVSFKPTAPGNTNGILTITNGEQTYEIALFGVGAETSKITIAPEIQTFNGLTIGDEVTAKVLVENKGAFPLKYFVPGHDNNGISQNWPSDYHSYGYNLRSNRPIEANPIPYEFKDISGTGTNITKSIIDLGSYHAVDMGFEFPYYGDRVKTLYIASKGFTTFDNSVRSVNVPRLNGGEWSPKGYVSILGAFLSYLTQGEVYYQVEPDRVIVQYDNVWDGWSFGESMTAQIVYHANGDIRFYYENLNIADYNKQNLTVLIEDLGQQDGILVSDWTQPADLYTGLALGFDFPGPNIITTVKNGSGVVMPGASREMEITLSTANLTEGLINRYVNIVNNDPDNKQKNALIQLEINKGGIAVPVVSADTVRFGTLFQGTIRNHPFTVKNPGTASLGISSMNFVNNSFTLSGDQPTTIAPGLFGKYAIHIPTDKNADLEDWLSINYQDGTQDTIYVTGKVVDAPGINVDLGLLTDTLAFGEKASHPITIENTGLSPLQVAPSGGNWLSFETEILPSSIVPDFGYTFEKYNNDEFYQWVEIRRTGTQMEFVDYEDFQGTYWRDLELPFPIEFYGQKYDKIKVGDNGIISFEDDPQAEFFTDYIPTATQGRAIMPYWTFSTFSDYFHKKEDIGIFYQFEDDKIIITWSIFINNLGGMGDPISAQVIFYKNGTMKFQYRPEEGGADLTSGFSTIGLQRSSTDGLSISAYQPLDHGKGLAYIIVPSRRYTIAPGASLTGDIVLDATNIYGGVYNKPMKFFTNVPNQEILEKPVELTVTGDPMFVMADTVDFGAKLVSFGSLEPTINTVDVVIENKGAAAFDITYASMADGTGPLHMMIEVPGFWGPEWTRIDNIWFWPTFTIRPGDKLVTRAIFFPSQEGEFMDEVVFQTSLGEQRLLLTGTAFEPASIRVATEPIYVSMPWPRTVNRTIALDNENGKSDLNYTATVDYLRPVGTSRTERLATTNANTISLTSKQVESTSATKISADYNRTLSHTDKEVPDTFIGTGGTAPFTLSTQFNAGPEGFNLSHIETFFRTENLTSAVIEVEIRAGGNSVADAAVITKGTLAVTSAGADDSGKWHQVTLDQTVGIYPNENFYVIVTYPLGIQFPQGTVTGIANVPGRFAYYFEGQWYEVQEGEFANAGWLMVAAEMEAGNFSWLRITEGQTGTLAKGETGVVSLEIDGGFGNPGNQSANILFSSNDPANPIVRVPVTLHMNEAPNFVGAPSTIAVAEADTLVVKFKVADPESNTVEVTAAQTKDFIEFGFASDTVSLVLKPDFGDKGIFIYRLKATDQYGAIRDLELPIEVLHTNRAPGFIGDAEAFGFLKPGNLTEHNLTDYFADPDNDEFTYTVSSSNESILTVFASASSFIIRTANEGNATITFKVTDKHGASKTVEIAAKVDLINGLEDLDQLFSLTVYPNPSTDYMRVRIKGEIGNTYSLRVITMQGVTMIRKDEVNSREEAVIDLRSLPKGVYLIEVTDMRGKSMRRIVKD
jgi:subtilisin family serine protease